MVSSVKSRRTHYEILGLKPTATDADIAAAFAAESRKIIQNPRVNEPDVREKARQVRTAHQTLRDPAKRAAYDESLGLAGEAPAPSPEAPGKPIPRPFVAAAAAGSGAEKSTRDFDRPWKPRPAPPEDQPAAKAPTDAGEERFPRKPRTPRPPRPATGLPEGLFVAGMAAKSEARAAEAAPADAARADAPPAEAAPADPSPADAPPADAVATDAPPTDASPADAAPTDAPEAAPQAESVAAPEPAPADDRFSFVDYADSGGYGERRSKLSRNAVAAMAAIAFVVGVLALSLWPAGNGVESPSSPSAERPMAAANGAPAPALDGLPSGEDPASPENSPELAAIADPGSYEALVISDDGPLPTTAAPPAGNETVAASGANAAAGSPQTPADRGTQSATAAAPAQPGATGAPAVAGATAPAVAAAPVRVQPAPDIRPVTAARLVGGSLLNSDNQRGAFQGTVSVRFTVTPGGRATGCRPTASSGNARLDAHTCELVEQRLQFTPAQTAQGRAVSSEVGATYTWGRKRRTITGRLLDLVR